MQPTANRPEPPTARPAVDPRAQAGRILGHAAGYVGLRTLSVGLRAGLLEALAKAPAGMSAAELAEATGCDPFLTQVWLRAAYASELLDLEAALPREDYDPGRRRFTSPEHQRYRLAPHMESLLLDEASPGFLGGLPEVLLQPEFFDCFEEALTTHGRLWWSDCSPELIRSVSRTSTPFYTRMIPGGLARVPGLEDRLARGGRIVELACGAGRGLVRLAEHFPAARLQGVDGDAHSLEVAAERLQTAGLAERVTLTRGTFEEAKLQEADLVFINVSMHECRDIDRVAARVHQALAPGGRFVISDFPFPAATEQTRTPAGRVMCGIQFFEALIDDQLMPTVGFEELLERHGFQGVGSFELTPVHAVTHGVRA